MVFMFFGENVINEVFMVLDFFCLLNVVVVGLVVLVGY